MTSLRYGFVLAYGDARTAAELAELAEQHGWDGFFCWEAIWGIDPWICLSAAAVRTERIRLGTMLTPLPRRRPWELANQTSTLDNLSAGRVTLSAGLGVAGEEVFWLFEDDPGRKVRAEMMDEGLEMLQHLWSGQTFDYEGKHYRSRRLDRDPMPPVAPPPVQQPRIPVWMVGAWPRPKSMRRAARWDGWLPNYAPPGGGRGELTPDVLAEAVEWIRKERAGNGLDMSGYDIVMEGNTDPTDPAAAAEKVRPWSEAGANWWLEADWSDMDPVRAREAAERRLRAGPPRL
jgi:alkanesulfonate monooxygenase SsuD/methylene tetrahydromethanopterin reductase-like flavin-dependent oxidoreductase (luciferase family)